MKTSSLLFGVAAASIPHCCVVAFAALIPASSCSLISSPRVNYATNALAAASRLLKIRGGSSLPLVPPPAFKAPPDSYQSAVLLGTNKGRASIAKILVMGIQAGFQLGIGSAMAVATIGGLGGLVSTNPALAKIIFGAAGLPCGLLLTVTTGSELFTGNTAIVGAAYLEKKVTTKQLLKNWFWSYAGNLIGTAALAWLCHYAGAFKLSAANIAAIATTKAALPFGVAFARGILCNWLVCSAVWLAQACADLTSKALAIVMLITIFVALGFEHSVANMWISPFAALNGGPSYLTFFLKNLVPVSLGNIIGGFLIVAGFQYFAFGSFGKKDN